MNDDKFKVLQPGKVLVDHGPLSIVIMTSTSGSPNTQAAVKGAKSALAAFCDLVSCLDIARTAIGQIQLPNSGYPEILNKMISSVVLLSEDDFTPMAAVAGTISDIARETAVKEGADRVIVNNGGDISLYTKDRISPFKVGIISDISKRVVTHYIDINKTENIGGIATSGLGGRSLTKGVASAVTVFAECSSMADAAATAIANACNCEDPAIKRCNAEEIDHLTDIRGHVITSSVGILRPKSIITALESGLNRAKDLYEIDMIKGAVIFVQKTMVKWPGDLTILSWPPKDKI